MKDRKHPVAKAAAPGPSPATGGTSGLARSRSFLRTQHWIWPLVAAVILVFVGVFVRRQMEGAMKTGIAGNLQMILNANTEALRAWAATERSRAESISEDTRVADLVAGIVQRASKPGVSKAELLASPRACAAPGVAAAGPAITTASPGTWCWTRISSCSPLHGRNSSG